MGSGVHLWASCGGWGTESLSWLCMSLLQPDGFLHTWARDNVRLFQLKCQTLRGNGHFRGSFPQPALCGVANMHYRFEWPKESSFKRSVNFFPPNFLLLVSPNHLWKLELCSSIMLWFTRIMTTVPGSADILSALCLAQPWPPWAWVTGHFCI